MRKLLIRQRALGSFICATLSSVSPRCSQGKGESCAHPVPRHNKSPKPLRVRNVELHYNHHLLSWESKQAL